MRIMAFTDSHGELNIIKKLVRRGQGGDIDAVVCAGDFTQFEKQLDVMLANLDVLGKPILVIPGNHEDPEMLEKKAHGFKNIAVIHKKTWNKKDITFLGWGTGGFSRHSEDFRETARQWRRQLSKGHGKLVLVTHAPPYKTELDKLNGAHVGNDDITAEIKRLKPVLAISGHIHENEGKQDKIGETLCVNPGWRGMVLDI